MSPSKRSNHLHITNTTETGKKPAKLFGIYYHARPSQLMCLQLFASGRCLPCLVAAIDVDSLDCPMRFAITFTCPVREQQARKQVRYVSIIPVTECFSFSQDPYSVLPLDWEMFLGCLLWGRVGRGQWTRTVDEDTGGIYEEGWLARFVIRVDVNG